MHRANSLSAGVRQPRERAARRAVEEVGVEAVLQPEQHLGRFAVRITPPLRRDIGAVVAATRPPTGGAQALLDLLAADISSRGGQATKRPSGKTPPARPRRQQ